MSGTAINIAFPWQIARTGGSALADMQTHVRDMIEQLLLTTAGERVNRPDFGAGLGRLVFEPNSIELAAAMQISIQAGLQRYLGDLIDVQTVQVVADDAYARILVDYRLRVDGTQAQAQIQLGTGDSA